MAFRPPIRIASASTPGGTILGIVYACDGASRAVLSSVLSLVGLKILDGDTFLLSIFFILWRAPVTTDYAVRWRSDQDFEPQICFHHWRDF